MARGSGQFADREDGGNSRCRVIAEGLAKRCRAFEMRVEGLTSRTEAPDFDRLRPYEELETAVADFDYFVLLAPLTGCDPEHRRRQGASGDEARVGADQCGARRDRGRSGADRVLEARPAGGRRSRRLRGRTPAARSPLWDLPNVLISRTRLDTHRELAQSVMPIVAANLAALESGREGELVNVVRRPL